MKMDIKNFESAIRATCETYAQALIEAQSNYNQSLEVATEALDDETPDHIATAIVKHECAAMLETLKKAGIAT